MGWKLVDHRADIGFEAEGDTLEEAFLEGTAAFLFVCTGMTTEELMDMEGEEETVAVSAEDPEELAVSWLNELLFRMETGSGVFVPQKMEISLSPPSLHAEGLTIPLNLDAISVKAATYGQMELRTSPRPFMRIFLDI